MTCSFRAFFIQKGVIMAKICSNCGNTNEDHQNFCTNCGNPLAQEAPPPPPEMASEFVPVIDPQPVAPPPPPPPPPAGEWQTAPTPPPMPVSEWQSAPTPPPPPAGEWQAPQPPPPGQYQQGYQAPPPHAPVFDSKQAKTEFNKSKGLFMDMIFACQNYSEDKKVRLAAVEFSDYA